jgi:hypothetical protein
VALPAKLNEASGAISRIGNPVKIRSGPAAVTGTKANWATEHFLFGKAGE